MQKGNVLSMDVEESGYVLRPFDPSTCSGQAKLRANGRRSKIRSGKEWCREGFY